MSDSMYERYKDALRRGHVAAMRGRLDQAVEAYVEASDIATERALPHTSLGAVLLKLGRPEDALAAYDAALARAARDESALLGRAEALSRLRRRTEAAESLDLAAEVQEAAGRVADACETARQALALAESKARRRYVEDVTRRLNETAGGDRQAEEALSKALRFLEVPTGDQPATAPQAEPTVEPVSRVEAEPPPEAEPMVEGAQMLEAAPTLEAELTPETESTPEVGPRCDAAPTVEAEPIPDGGPAVEAEPVVEPAQAVAEGLLARGSEPTGEDAGRASEASAGPGVVLAPAIDPDLLILEAEAAIDQGDMSRARTGLLEAAAGFTRAELFNAALDACHRALAIAPDDAALHLALVDIYLANGWRGPAADKLVLLSQLVDLAGDQAARRRLCAVATANFSDDPRLSAICA